MRCPRCAVDLDGVREEHGLLYRCARCGGCSASMAVLRKRLTAQVANTIWRAARASDGPGAAGAADAPCPACARPMAPVVLGEGPALTTLDGCARCQVVWFDDTELARVPVRPPSAALSPLTPAQAEAHVQMQMAAALQRGALGEPDSASDAAPISGRARLQGWVGRAPWLSLALALVLIAVQLHRSIGRVGEADAGAAAAYREQVEEAAFDGTDPWRLGGRTAITSFFASGSSLRRWRVRERPDVKSVLLLVVAGYLLERRLGRLRFAGLLVAGHGAALLAHVLAALPREAGFLGAWPALASAYGWAAVVLGRAYLNARRLKGPWWERWHAGAATHGAFVALLFAIFFFFATVTAFLVPWEDIAARPFARGTGGALGGFAGGLAGLLLGLLTLARVRRGGGS